MTGDLDPTTHLPFPMEYAAAAETQQPPLTSFTPYRRDSIQQQSSAQGPPLEWPFLKPVFLLFVIILSMKDIFLVLSNGMSLIATANVVSRSFSGIEFAPAFLKVGVQVCASRSIICTSRIKRNFTQYICLFWTQLDLCIHQQCFRNPSQCMKERHAWWQALRII